MRVNETKRRLLAGKATIGVGMTLGAPLAAEVVSLAGFDFVMVDNQHGAWDENGTMAAFRSICMGSATPAVRVQKNDFYTIGRVLDRGALIVVVPMVNSAEEAKAAAYAVRYPPQGGRSAGAFGTSYLGEDYAQQINEQVYLAVQIETITAVEHAEEILAVEGVDGCWAGPWDLAQSMGVELGTAAHDEAVLRILDACRKTGKVPGIAATPQIAQHRLEQGFLFVTVGTEMGMVRSTSKDVLARLEQWR